MVRFKVVDNLGISTTIVIIDHTRNKIVGKIDYMIYDENEYADLVGIIDKSIFVQLMSLFIHPDERNQGYANKLMIYFMDYCKKNYPKLSILLQAVPDECFKSIPLGLLIKFYEGFGFFAMENGLTEESCYMQFENSKQ